MVELTEILMLPRWARAWQLPAVLVLAILFALVCAAAEDYFDPGHRLNAALSGMALSAAVVP